MAAWRSCAARHSARCTPRPPSWAPSGPCRRSTRASGAPTGRPVSRPRRRTPAAPRRLARRPAQQHVAESDLAHAAALEVVEPRVVQAIELRGSGAGAPVADPRLGVLGAALHLPFDDPVVERTGPGAHALEAVLAVAHLPVAEQLRDPAGLQVLGGPAHHGLDDPVAHHAAVAVLVLGHPGRPRRDHERRVRDDPVEALPRDGLVEAPEPELDSLDPVQLDVQSGEVQRTPRDVGRDDALREPGRVHRLDAAAGAEVEHGARRRRQHQARQGHRRTAHAEHVLLPERMAERHLPEVGQDPPVALPAGVDERVRPQVEQGPHGCRGGRARRLHPAEQPELDRAVAPRAPAARAPHRRPAPGARARTAPRASPGRRMPRARRASRRARVAPARVRRDAARPRHPRPTATRAPRP